MHAFVFWRWSRSHAFVMVVFVVAGLIPGTLLAESRPFGWQWHGFATQGIVATDRNNFFGPSSDGASLQFTELGINVSLRPWPDTLLAAQVISRRAGGESKDAQPALDYALIDRQIQASALGNWGIRAGRVKNPLGLYNETRDVAVTRPGILLPQSIYFDRTRSLGLSSDSVALYANRIIGNGDLRFKLNVGIPQTGEDVEWATLGRPEPGSFRGETSVIGQLAYEHDGGRIIAAVGGGDVRARFRSRPNGPGNADFRFRPWVFSLQYNAENWDLTGEYARRSLRLSGLDNPLRDFDLTGESAYLQYSYRITPRWTWRLRYDVLFTDRSDRSGSRFRSQHRPARAYAIREGLEHGSSVAGEPDAEPGRGIPSCRWHGLATRDRQPRSDPNRSPLGHVAWTSVPAFLNIRTIAERPETRSRWVSLCRESASSADSGSMKPSRQRSGRTQGSARKDSV